MKTIFKKDQKFANWTLKDFLGSGGNGEVWSCVNELKEERAIKILKNIKHKSYVRFIDETTIIEKNADIKGIIPLVDKFLPKNLNGQTPFYVMQLALSAEKQLYGSTLATKIDALIQVAETLKELHQRSIFHRDIKPANILYYNATYHLADFGLVDYPNKREISRKNEEIGAKWTMAPEMKRESSKADASKADIYSLAKTLWIFLTQKAKGFDGQYSTDSIIDLKNVYWKTYTVPIDDLLFRSTDNDPSKRPTIDEFIQALHNWKNLSQNFHDRNQQQWFEIQSKLFPSSIPSRVVWENIADIIKVLKLVCTYDNLNHLFFPRSGGLDLLDVRLAAEEGCLELDFQSIHIIKPKRLIFESFGFNPEWNYFRLEADDLRAHGDNVIRKFKDAKDTHDEIGVVPEEQIEFAYEDLSELSPGEYFPYRILNDRSYYEVDYYITRHSRHIKRWIKGSFVIFGKRSVYNRISSTYDGRHNTMSADEFRDYIKRSVNGLKGIEIAKASNNDNPAKEVNKKSKIKHIIQEDIVYRCGWCGDIVAADGAPLDHHTREYNFRVINKFGFDIVRKVTGKCCEGKYE